MNMKFICELTRTDYYFTWRENLDIIIWREIYCFNKERNTMLLVPNIRSHFIRLFEKWNEGKTLITHLPRQYANVLLTVIEVQSDRTFCTALMDSGCSSLIISQFVSYKEGRMWTWWLLMGKLISTVASNSSINLCMCSGDPVMVEIFIVAGKSFDFLFGIKALSGIQINQSDTVYFTKKEVLVCMAIQITESILM